jgi:RNA polymerase sigma-70 factor (ECF subfamily)
MIGEAERELAIAARRNQMGRFQLEAAIQSVHADRRRTGRTDWQAIALLYEGLVRLSPTLGAEVARAAAVAEVKGAAAALDLLAALDEATVAAYQPYWAVRAHLLARLGRTADAAAAYARAIALAGDPAVKRFLTDALHVVDSGSRRSSI